MHNLAHSIRLYPTKAQEVFFRKACGCARVAYNYGLQEYQRILSSGNKPSIYAIKKQFNQDKKTLYPWMSETNKDANQQPFANLQTAFNRFFKKQGKFPTFHKKGRRDSFYISNDKFGIEGMKVWVPKLGWVRGTEALRFKGRITSATIRRKAHYWFVVVSVETDQTFTTCENQAVVGVDLGIKTLATMSDGETLMSPKPLRIRLKRLKMLQRKASRKIKGSSNRWKANQKVAKVHYEVACQRKDTLDKLTTHLCHYHQIIVIEDLNVKGMVKNHNLALSILDLGWGEFRRQLEYKSALHGNTVIVADRWFSSSKMCSRCGNIKETLSLSDRVYKCDCGMVIDRDLNASINLRNYGLNKIGKAIPEFTPAEMEGLTTVDEAGISCSLVST